MVEENSGKVFAFKLDHNFGFGFAEAYDFSDDHPFSGRLIFVYNLIVNNLEQSVSLAKIVSSGIMILYSMCLMRRCDEWRQGY